MHAPYFECVCVCVCHIYNTYSHQESVSLVAAILGYQLFCCFIVVAAAAAAIESTFIHKSTYTVAQFNTQQIETKIQPTKKKKLTRTNQQQQKKKYVRFTFLYTFQN